LQIGILDSDSFISLIPKLVSGIYEDKTPVDAPVLKYGHLQFIVSVRAGISSFIFNTRAPFMLLLLSHTSEA
jgi:hypothetical protein